GKALNFNGEDEYLEHAWDGLLDVDLYTTVHFEAVFNFSSGE
ncbi:hypothetical protein D1BOALGB6SA_9265, partial [Olavius sp. associated proteobacterium Delta 1]